MVNFSFTQNSSRQKSLSKVVEDLIYSNPDESLKIAAHLIDKENISDTDKAELYLSTAIAYKIKGDYSKALIFLFKNVNKSDFVKASEFYLRFQILDELLLSSQAEIEYNKLVDLKNETEDVVVVNLINEIIILNNFLKSSNSNEVLFDSESVQLKNNFEKTVYIDYLLQFSSNYIENGKYNLAEETIEKVNAVIQQLENLSYYKSVAFLQNAKISFYQKKYNESLQLLDLAQKEIEVIKNKYVLEEIEETRVINFIALNDSENYTIANADVDKIHADVENLDQEAANSAYNLIIEDQNNKTQLQENKYLKVTKVIGLFFLGIILLLMTIWYKNNQKSRHFSEIISYLKITRKNLISDYKEKKEYSKKISIPQKTEEIILAKLKKFEGTTKFLSKDLSLAVLAGQFETNTKYLSEIINSNYNVNFNTYINKLRINYVVDKLKTDSNYLNYKISYLAESSGFSSHSSFATVFKSITGISPVKFIELLKEEKSVA